MEFATVYVWKNEEFNVPGGNWSLVEKYEHVNNEMFGSIDRIEEFIRNKPLLSGTYFVSVVGLRFGCSQGTIVQIQTIPKVERPKNISL